MPQASWSPWDQASSHVLGEAVEPMRPAMNSLAPGSMWLIQNSQAARVQRLIAEDNVQGDGWIIMADWQRSS